MRRLRGQEGQSLLVVVGTMLVILLIAALAIDVSSWYQKHHQAQVAADSAALAAADCLLQNNSTSTTSTSTCQTATDTTRASSVATTIAQTNSVPIAGSVTYGTSPTGVVTNVTVTTATSSPSFFARAAGILSANISARAVASLNWTFHDCPAAGSGCLMFYAASDSCGTGSNAAIQMQIGSSDTLNGGIFTNGSVDDSKGNGGSITGPVTYGTGSTCQTNTSFKANADKQGAVQQSPSNRGSAANPNWPIDFSTDFPACSTDCGSGGTPSYCTYSATKFTAYQGAGVYCAYGSGTASTPSTWNGTISFPSGTGTSSSPASVTLIGGNIALSSNSTYTAYSQNLFAYAACTSACKNGQNPYFSAVGGGLTFSGDVFVPNGQASFTGGNVNFTGFTEALTIIDLGGNQTGDGPSFSGGPQLIPGSSTLSQ